MTIHNGSLAVLFLVSAGWSLAGAADSPEPPGPVKDRAGFLPLRKQSALKGKVVGVLVSDVRAVMARDGRSGPPDAVGFSTANQSYRWVYLPVAEKEMITNLRVEVGEKAAPAQVKVYPKLSMASPTLLKPKGIGGAYTLVEVEVNDGLGSPPTEGFVATKITRLDGTAKYPLDLTRAVNEAKELYRAHLKARQKRADLEMDRVKKKALKGRAVTGPKETSELLYLTWLPDGERVRVAFVTRISDGSYQEVEGGARPGPGGRPRPGLRPPPPPRGFKVRTGVTFGVELGMSYEIDRKGKVTPAEELAPEGFSQELPPPP